MEGGEGEGEQSEDIVARQVGICTAGLTKGQSDVSRPAVEKTRKLYHVPIM